VKGTNTMRLQHSFLVCAVWLLALHYTAASSKRYRIMWVSTAGKDSPQCTHDGVASGPVPYPRHRNEVCRSLNYALTHIQSDSLIIVTCGIHVLEPVGSPSDHTPLSNIASIRIRGSRNCEHGRPQIQCTNGANLAFYNVETVVIARLDFLDCGEQLRHSNSFFISSTLHFQESMSVTIDRVAIHVTGPYGVGISFIRRNNTATQGNCKILLETVIVEHHGFHGSGIHFDAVTSQNISQTGENLKLDNIHIISRNVHPSHGLSRKFTGINITVRGDGEGGEISLSSILIIVCPNRTTRGNGISLVLLDRVHGYRVSFRNTFFLEKCENHHNSSNMTVDGITVDATHDFTSAIYTIVSIELGGNSMGNHILMTTFGVLKYGVTPAVSNTLSIVVKDQSQDNVVLLQQIQLVRSDNSSTHKRDRGLQVIVTGWAMRNEIQVMGLHSGWHKAAWGAGVYVEFSRHAQGNSVNLINSTLLYNHAVRDGGIAIVCRDFATQNAFNITNLHIPNNFAELGGGVYVLLKDSSHNNSVYLTNMYLVDNTAHCGGGMFVQIQDTSVAGRVETLNSLFWNNTLLPSEIHTMMGGGVHVEFSTVGATFRTDNSVSFTGCVAMYNTAMQGVGGGISVLYKHSHYQGESGDSVTLDTVHLFQNKAVSGSACAFQSLPTHGKRLFKGVRLMYTQAFLSTTILQAMDKDEVLELFYLDVDRYLSDLINEALDVIWEQMGQTIVPTFQMDTNTNLILVNSVRVTVGQLFFFCAASSQGIYALDSEIVLQANTLSTLSQCVATHGGAIALYGESYIRVGKNTTLMFIENHAFQRGGAIYANSAPGVVPVSNCFLQIDQLQDGEENKGAIIFRGNSAKAEGKSVYVSEIRNCFSGNTLKNITTNFAVHHPEEIHINISLVRQVIFTFAYRTLNTHVSPQYIKLISKQYIQMLMQQEIASGPSHVGGATVDLSKPLTISFIPGKQKRLPYTHAYDEFGSNISSVFTVLINKMNDSVPVELDPFSKYTADFTVILHGIPQRHGMYNYSVPGNTTNTTAVGTPPQQHGMTNNSFFSNTTNTAAVDKPPQLVLQSVDNKNLLLAMNIKIRCCPPGYVFQYGSGDTGTCHCGMTSVTGIAECNETDPEVIGAVLERDYWAGYLPSNARHSCDGQKLFTGSCPPGYCQTQQVTLPENNSQQELQGVLCTGANRKGLLCGDCLDGKGIAVNFNGIRPVCASCQEGISYVGIPVWFLTEWVPMLAFMFVLMLFNVDLVSGRFNSFLLFAQLLAFSTIRSDAELGPVHNAFVKIYRFLYGMWNLDFFGVLLPPYCLAPHAHLTLLQTLLLHYSIGLFPLTVAITLIVLERSAEKWICCHRVDQCLRRMRRWKAKYSDGMSYDRALPAFVILGFTRFLVSSSYILVSQTITGEDGEGKLVVWWQGSVPYGSIQHIAYFIPAIGILLVFVLLPSFLLLTLPIGPQLFGRLIIAVPALRRLQRVQTFCSNVYTDRWIYHFVNVFQGCYKERFRSFSSLYLFHRIVHLLVAVFIPRAEDALRIQIFLTVALLLLIATCQPYSSSRLNTLDAAILGNLALILILSLHITDFSTPIGTRQFYASLQLILIYLTLLYPCSLLGKKVYLKCRQLRCCQKQQEQQEDNAEPLLEAPAERLGNLVLITELRAGVPTAEDDYTATETETETES